jgi:hypothetical protein
VRDGHQFRAMPRPPPPEPMEAGRLAGAEGADRVAVGADDRIVGADGAERMAAPDEGAERMTGPPDGAERMTPPAGAERTTGAADGRKLGAADCGPVTGCADLIIGAVVVLGAAMVVRGVSTRAMLE